MSKSLISKPLGLATPKSEILEKWGKYAHRKQANVAQQKEIWIAAKRETDLKNVKLAVSAAASVNFCNRRVIVEKQGDQYKHVGAWYCGKRYCSFCSNRKRRKILNRFSDFFNSDKGKNLLKDYDLALFTVTLQHNKTNKRTEPYYKELSQHWNHALKYGAFQKFIKGGFYNTEHTYTKNGHHIHRHSMVLIPRQFNVLENFELIENELRIQWKQRTNGSHQIDLRPLGWDEKSESCLPRYKIIEDINSHMMEVTKYITKRDEKGVIAWEVIKAIEQNNRSKFYGKFGILYKIRELNFTEDKWELLVDNQQVKTSNNKKYLEKFVEKNQIKNYIIKEIEPEIEEGEKRELYIGTPVIRRKKEDITISKSKYKKQKSKINDIDYIRVIKTGSEKESRWKKTAISYEIKDLIKIEDNRDSFLIFKDLIREDVYRWKLDKWSNLMSGNTVEMWRSYKSGILVNYHIN